ILEGISEALMSRGINNIITCTDSRQVMEILNKQEIELILLDLMMPHLSGENLLPRIVTGFPDIPVIVLTGLNDLSIAVECMKVGACDYMVKAVEENRLLSGVKKAIEIRELKREYSELKSQFLKNTIDNEETFSDIITNNPKMKAIFIYIGSVSETGHPVLITGETGVGKGLVAEAIHRLSRREGEYIAVNISGFDDTMFTDTLFGHKKGAFTGANQARSGLVARAAAGTLFLDEIGDLSLSSQTKLLRLLEDGEYFPLGSDLALHSDARIVAATNNSIAELVDQGRFRKDLYYRLKIHEIEVPPLRERRDDLPLLIGHFLTQAADELHKQMPTAPPEIYQLLGSHDFPGNIRELKSMILDAVSRHQGKVMSLESFKTAMSRKETKPEPCPSENIVGFSARLPTLKEIDRLLIEEALKRSGGNMSVAAMHLGISAQAVSKRLKRAEQ
ncbi:hypothetical protein LCGC14_2577850, partial [marine sediment metagenome]